MPAIKLAPLGSVQLSDISIAFLVDERKLSLRLYEWMVA